MMHVKILPIVILLWTSIALSAPTISNVGTTIHGESATISGSDFGTKSTAAPIRWDNCEAFTVDNDLSTESGWWTRRSGYPDGVISDENQRNAKSDKNIKAVIVDGPGGGSDLTPNFWRDNVGFSTTQKIYANVWIRWHWGDVNKGSLSNNIQIKGLEFVGGIDETGGGTGIGHNCFHYYYYSGSYTNTYVANYGTSAPSFYWPDNTFEDGVWHNIVFIMDEGTPGSSDGSFYGYVGKPSGFVANNSNGTGKNLLDADDDHVNAVKFFNYMTMWDDPLTNTATIYYDDIYIDNSWARVEIGNNATYANCTKREIQIPTAWSTTSISATVNQGSLPDGTAYLFVIDENGDASSGYAITLSSSTPTSTGIIATGVHMQ